MGMDHSTMRRKMQALEASLGTTLFSRRDGHFCLNPGNDALLEAAHQMEAASTLFAHQSEAIGRGGLIRISTLDIFASLLAPDFVTFSQRNPDVVLHVTTEPHFVDLERESVDIAVRLARPIKGLNGLKKLSSLRFGVFCSPTYIDQFGTFASDRQRLLTICAHFNHADHDFELADQQWNLRKDQFGKVVGSADTYSTLLRLCEEGLGLAILPCFMTIASHLVPFGPPDESMEVDIWIVIRKDIAQSPKIRLVVEFLTETFHRYRALLEQTSSLQKSSVGHPMRSVKLDASKSR